MPPTLAPGQWRTVGRLHCLRLDSGVGVLLWDEDGCWDYRTSGLGLAAAAALARKGAHGLADELVRRSAQRDVALARKEALRWLAHRGALVADQASAVLMDTGTR